MRDQLQRRLEALKNEFNAGRARSADLEQQQATLHQTLLRISGAIQVLEEELKTGLQDAMSSNGTPPKDATETDPRQVNGSPAHARA